MLGGVWDDASLPLSLKSHDSLGFGTNDAFHRARRDAFFESNDPLDVNWLGDSSFQGLVYAGGDVNVNTKFRVVGAVIAQGDVNLNNDSKLIFNEDYKDLVGSQLPLGLVFYEEL